MWIAFSPGRRAGSLTNQVAADVLIHPAERRSAIMNSQPETHRLPKPRMLPQRNLASQANRRHAKNPRSSARRSTPPPARPRPHHRPRTGAPASVSAPTFATKRAYRKHAGRAPRAIWLWLRAWLVYASRLAAHPYQAGPGTSGFEILAMRGATAVFAGTRGSSSPVIFSRGAEPIGRGQ
jgi:hypothetical protein